MAQSTPLHVIDPPGDLWPDRTVSLLRDGYEFIPGLFDEHRSDVVRTRLMGRQAICLRGMDAARMFYESGQVQRTKAVPRRVQRSLFGSGGVQTLDGADHQHRKSLFTDVLDDEHVVDLTAVVGATLEEAALRWRTQPRIVLGDAMREVLFTAVCVWAGVPIEASDVPGRSRDMHEMVDGFAAIGPRHWKARMARRRSEQWMEGIVEQFRARQDPRVIESPLARVAAHTDRSGRLLPAPVVAVEVLNLIRPTVAIGRFVEYAALAMHRYGPPGTSDDELERYVEEVRRFFPFTPFLGGRASRDFVWQRYRIPKGSLIVLDVYGLLHDPRLWDDPAEFRPERFSGEEPGDYGFIPQGGGVVGLHHRCPGESVTVEITKTVVRFIVEDLAYTLPEQSLTIDLGRIPARPASRVVISPGG